MTQKVVIIGAGLSGLTCAYRLEKAGYKPQVFEARKRVGGRVFTVDVDGHIGELGAQNISDGGEATCLKALAKELNLELEHTSHTLQTVYDDGSTTTKVIPTQVEPDALEELSTSCTNLEEMIDTLFKKGDLLHKVLDRVVTSYDGAPAKTISSKSHETLQAMLSGGLSTFKISAIKGGNSKLPEAIASNLHSSIHFEHVLTRVDKGQKAKYKLNFANGNEVECDLLILSLPPPLYASISVNEEILPSQRKEAMSQINFGKNSKILVPITDDEYSTDVYLNDRLVNFFGVDKRLLQLYFSYDFATFNQDTIQQVLDRESSYLQRTYHIDRKLTVTYASETLRSYKGPVGYSWPNEPFTKGSYSSLGINQTPQDLQYLFSPIHNSLYFIGEHTTKDPSILGTMEAAVESGERTAKSILKDESFRNSADKF